MIAALLLIALLSGIGRSVAVHQSGSIVTQPVAIVVDPTKPGMTFAADAIGLSIEADELATADLSPSHLSLVELMRHLGPGVLRLGGNSLDYSWWTTHDERPPSWATSVITPSDLAQLHRLLVRTGWHAIVGVDLGHFEPARAASEAHIAEAILGSTLLGVEIGNEPNSYGKPTIALRPRTYGPSDYLAELAAYSSAIRFVAPAVRLFGPDLSGSDLSSQTWLSATTDTRTMPFSEITQHYYPTSYSTAKGTCKATSAPTAATLLSPGVREHENAVLQAIARAGRAARRPTRISETNNTASCDTSGGPATSPVFASALWSLDWILRSVSAGIAGINFHGYFGRCAPDTVSPICADGHSVEARGQVLARPEFYGLMAARQLADSHFLPLHIAEQGELSTLTAYATVHPDGTITLAIDNFAPQSTAYISVAVPGYTSASSERLLAPSVSATKAVTLGNASFGAAGGLKATRTTMAGDNSPFQLVLPPASALIVWFRK